MLVFRICEGKTLKVKNTSQGTCRTPCPLVRAWVPLVSLHNSRTITARLASAMEQDLKQRQKIVSHIVSRLVTFEACRWKCLRTLGSINSLHNPFC